jgi:hypothetical protein
MREHQKLQAAEWLAGVGVGKVVRRTLVSSALLGAGGLAVAASLGYLLVGIGVLVGVALGVVNIVGMARTVNRAVSWASATGNKTSKRSLAGSTLSRLGVITAVVCLLLVYLDRVGLGCIVGLILFQMSMLASSCKVVFAQLRREAGL